jgi:hypothetical protein
LRRKVARPSQGLFDERPEISQSDSLTSIWRNSKRSSAPVRYRRGPQSASAAIQPRGRAGLKKAIVQDLVGRPEGATLSELMKETGWQAHSVRGFLSGTLKKKMGLPIHSAKSPDGARAYRIVSK